MSVSGPRVNERRDRKSPAFHAIFPPHLARQQHAADVAVVNDGVVDALGGLLAAEGTHAAAVLGVLEGA